MTTDRPVGSSRTSSSSGSETAYLETSDAYYSGEMLANERYATPYPNAEEAQRAGAILGYAGRIGEAYTRTGRQLRILEVGCGRGWLANLLSVYGPTTAIDPAPGPVRLAQRMFPDIDFENRLLASLLAEDDFEPFDLVVSSEVLEHVPNPSKKNFVEELYRALRPGGSAILTTPRGEMFGAYRRAQPQPMQPIEDWLSERALRSLTSECGFEIVDQQRTYSRRLGRLSRILLSGRLRRLLRGLQLGPFATALRDRYALYQVIWLRRPHSREQK